MIVPGLGGLVLLAEDRQYGTVSSASHRPAGGPCQGPCNARWRDTQRRLDAHQHAMEAWETSRVGEPPKEPEIPEGLSPWPGDPVFCGRCAAYHHRQLGELADLAAIAEAENTGHRKGPDSQRVSGSKHAPSPSPVVDDLDEMASMLRGWWSDALGADEIPPRAGYLQSEIGTSVARLSSRHWNILITDPDRGPEFVREISWWHRHLQSATRSGTGRHQKNRPCPRCQRYSLVWTEGDNYVACQTPTCNRLMTLDEYDTWDAVYANGGTVVNATTAA